MMTAGGRQQSLRYSIVTAAVLLRWNSRLVAPILFLLILGITQFGITLNNYEMLTGAHRRRRRGSSP